jgi:hypothetical protein
MTNLLVGRSEDLKEVFTFLLRVEVKLPAYLVVNGLSIREARGVQRVTTWSIGRLGPTITRDLRWMYFLFGHVNYPFC